MNEEWDESSEFVAAAEAVGKLCQIATQLVGVDEMAAAVEGAPDAAQPRVLPSQGSSRVVPSRSVRDGELGWTLLALV